MLIAPFQKVDLILLHAPSIYDFRKIPKLLGPISDVIPSTPIFEMYPIGFSTIAEYLNQQKISARIINLAYRMLDDPKFNVEKFISKLKTRAFGIDLHWLPHAHGSIEIAKICKKYHPDIPVIFGGYSATYFHQDLIAYPAVDFVLRGDSTEEWICQLIQAIISKQENYHEIPSLTWKNAKKEIIINPLQEPKIDLNKFSNNYVHLFKTAVKYIDYKNLTAIRDWWEYPISVIMTCRGCTRNCAICGGSEKGAASYLGREKPTYRSPELVAKDIGQINRFTRAPIFVVGDLHQFGYDYARTFFNELKKYQVKNELVFELFVPAKEEFFDWLAEGAVNFNFEISPESHDVQVRKNTGKNYSNEAMEQNIQWALDRGCKKIDIFFMIGLSTQTYQSVMETVEYCEYLIDKFGKRLVPFISPLAPFLDPGSIAFENAEKYGYKIRFKKLEDYRQALLEPSWKHVLSYETEWMDREAIVQASYEAGRRLTQIKVKYELISKSEGQKILININDALEKHAKIEKIYMDIDIGEEKKQSLLSNLGLNMEQDSISTICYKHELRWPRARRAFKFGEIIKAILFE